MTSTTTTTRCGVAGCEMPMNVHNWDTLTATGEPVRYHDVQTWTINGDDDAGTVLLGATEIPGSATTYDVQVDIPDWSRGLTAAQTRSLAATLLTAADRLDEITATS